MKPLTDIPAAIDRRLALINRTKCVSARNSTPLVSITFDDFPATAARTGADILEARGVRGSYYLCGGLAERAWENGPQFDTADLARLSQRGHEIGCHTFEHLDSTRQSASTLEASLDNNLDYVRDQLGDTVLSTFSYPYGYYNSAAKLQLQRRFAACRGIVPGVNAGTIDLGLLKSVAVPRRGNDASWIAPWLKQSQRSNGWLILFTHDVAPEPGAFGCTPDMLAATVDAILAAGIEILPLKTALGRITCGAAA